jgi:hypothetical protein
MNRLIVAPANPAILGTMCVPTLYTVAPVNDEPADYLTMWG